MRAYLLGAQGLAGSIRNHAVAWTHVGECSPQLAAIGPNVALRRTAFEYTLVEKESGYAAVLYNLAGFICVLIIKGNPRDVWLNTRVSPESGEISQPQHAGSWIFTDMFEYLIQGSQNLGKMSDLQKTKIDAAVRRNPHAPAVRFWKRDRQIEPVLE
jgi:hypothetical protein